MDHLGLMGEYSHHTRKGSLQVGVKSRNFWSPHGCHCHWRNELKDVGIFLPDTSKSGQKQLISSRWAPIADSHGVLSSVVVVPLPRHQTEKCPISAQRSRGEGCGDAVGRRLIGKGRPTAGFRPGTNATHHRHSSLNRRCPDAQSASCVCNRLHNSASSSLESDDSIGPSTLAARTEPACDDAAVICRMARMISSAVVAARCRAFGDACEQGDGGGPGAWSSRMGNWLRSFDVQYH